MSLHSSSPKVLLLSFLGHQTSFLCIASGESEKEGSKAKALPEARCISRVNPVVTEPPIDGGGKRFLRAERRHRARHFGEAGGRSATLGSRGVRVQQILLPGSPFLLEEEVFPGLPFPRVRFSLDLVLPPEARVCCPGLRHAGVPAAPEPAKRRETCQSHLARGNWDLRREQACKLLARQFRDDCLYVCDWPGCVHSGEKRKYMLFRGVFKNFGESRVWRSINDEKRRKVDVECAFCTCRHTWDLHSAFCLRRGFGYHRDGEPVVRAYVCENGHVSGAWTDVPLFS
ncbi:Phytochrome A-associated F-box protein [Spatholobus suberectus]|nr:Phytochrome A-associated F-box protein [Spatholobus suberectus]